MDGPRGPVPPAPAGLAGPTRRPDRIRRRPRVSMSAPPGVSSPARWLFAVVGAAIAAAIAGWFGRFDDYERALTAPFAAHGGEVVFRVGSGSTVDSLAERLEVSGVIRDAAAFAWGVEERGLDRRLQAGLYRFDAPLTGFEVMERIAGGEVATVRLTIPEGLDIEATAAALERQGFGDAGALEALFRDGAMTRRLIGDLDPEATDLEGYLFPSTYRLSPEVRPAKVVEVIVGQFRRMWDAERRALGKASGRSLRELATLASIVEKETGSAPERPRIASVFWNRLRIGMPLQSDPTVLYAMRRNGYRGNNIRRDDLQMESRWNTYRVPGIPPGPISSFGAAAFDAVLRPEETDLLYFVSRNDGTHEFSRTLREHNRAVRRWQIEYFRNRR